MTLSFTSPFHSAAPSHERLGLAEIFHAHSRRVRGFCYRMLRDHTLAEDAASEIFLRVREAIHTYNGSVPVERWLLRIAANHCIDILRRRKLERRWMVEDVPFEPPSSDASPLTLLLLQEQRGAVERALQELDEAYRMPLILRYSAGLSYDEIGAELGIGKTQVAGRIFRAKQMLRLRLKEIS
jgi:RNA polymerase sigma-70 factor, ECF subfamily